MRPSPLLTAVGASAGTFLVLGGTTAFVSGVALSVAKRVMRARRVSEAGLRVLAAAHALVNGLCFLLLPVQLQDLYDSCTAASMSSNLQTAAATPCAQCTGSGFLPCQICMGAQGGGYAALLACPCCEAALVIATHL